MKDIAIIGATGSIGRQAMDVVARHGDLFRVVALSAHRDEAGLLAAMDFVYSLSGNDPDACLSGGPPADDRIARSGAAGLARMIEECGADIVLNAAAGADGLGPTFAAIRSGKDLALANKESIVMAGRLVLAEATLAGVRILPVDSEHSALFNMIERFGRRAVRGVIITASGGAFRDVPMSDLATASLQDALAHPTWNMGGKITVDSATMANKGLEVIEAARLFGLEAADISVVIHPESRVHSFIRTRDGSLYAQLSRPDMRIPILNALTWPDVADEDVADLDPVLHGLSFRAVDPNRYPLLGLAYQALRNGEGHTDAYNAANEVAVSAFMEGALPFTAIASVVDSTLQASWPSTLDDLESVLEIDARARQSARRAVLEHA